MAAVTKSKLCQWKFKKAFGNATLESWFDYIKLTPQKEWNYSGLSKNPNISWDIVLANPDKAWDYGYFSLNQQPHLGYRII